jgi:uncharacterized membrane protein YhhN
MPAYATVLLGLWAVLLFGGFALGRPDRQTGRRMPRWTRLGSSLVLAGAAWLWWSQAPGPYPLLIAAGMTLGLLGDLCLARVIPGGLPAGMGAFGLGHLAYIAGFVSLVRPPGISPTAVEQIWLAALVAGAVGWYLLLFRGQRLALLHWAALPYSLLLMSPAGIAVGIALQTPSFWPLAVGALLFVVSDVMLAARRFRSVDFPLVEDLIWLTYGPAQACIVFGSMSLALPLLP